MRKLVMPVHSEHAVCAAGSASASVFINSKLSLGKSMDRHPFQGVGEVEPFTW
jgi:hypothetical protein